MLDGTARTWLKSLPGNSVGSWAELKHRFIQNFKDTCKQPMSIVDLAACVQEEGESTTPPLGLFALTTLTVILSIGVSHKVQTIVGLALSNRS